MLQEVLEHIHNYFIHRPNPGTYKIEGGVISPLPAFLEGQRIWIVGSVLNDGVYTFHADGIRDDDDKNAAGLQDETFAGTICALAVPPAVIALSEEISQWVDDNSDVLNSPLASESFNGYSYTLKTGGSTGGDSAGQIGWQSIFGKRLNRWRKLCL